MSNADHKLQIKLGCPSGFGFHVVRRGQQARDEQRVVNFKTGHKKFDEFASVDGYPHDQLLDFLKDPTVRDAMSALLLMGFDEVALTKGELSAIWTHFPENVTPAEELVANTHKRLKQIAAQVKPPRAAEIRPKPSMKLLPLAIVICVAVGALLFGYSRRSALRHYVSPWIRR